MESALWQSEQGISQEHQFAQDFGAHGQSIGKRGTLGGTSSMNRRCKITLRSMQGFQGRPASHRLL